MDFHWPSFLAGVGATIFSIVALVLLIDHRQRRHVRRRERAALARKALARDVLVRLGDAPLTTLDHESGYLEAVLDATGEVRPLSEAEASRARQGRGPDEATISAHQRLALHQAISDAVAALPRRRLAHVRHALPDGLLLVSLYLPGPNTHEEHSVWTGRIDGSEGRRVVFHERFDE